MSSRNPSGGTSADFILAPNLSGTNNNPALTDLSPGDRPWDTRRAESDVIQQHYEGTYFQRYADRIKDCSQLLDFRLVPNSNGVYRLKLSSTRLCHTRTCQVCAWRRSLMYKARAYKALPRFISDYPKTRYVFLTLTCKNCDIHELRGTIRHLNQSFARLTKLKAWPGIGYLKTVETTRGKDGVTAHPHLHVLVALEPSYYSRHYLSKKEWIKLWRQSLRVDYKPILDVQAIKVKDSPIPLLAEIIKYQAKPSSLTYATKEWFLEYTRQIHGTKAFALGGVFKKYFREFNKDETDEEMIGSDDEGDIDEGHMLFGWKRWEKRYRLKQ